MSRITVIGGTGYAGSAIVAEAVSRGHEVTALSRSLPAEPTPNVRYVQGDATDEATLASAIEESDVVVGALAPRGDLASAWRDFYRSLAERADTAGVRLYIVGGASSLRPAPGVERFVSDLSGIPEELHEEIRLGAAFVMEDLPATSPSLDWVFVSPALRFGAHMPAEELGRYRLGDDVAVAADGGAISAADYALGMVDLIESGEHHRAHVNLGH
ncbi:NAD(P)-dependent oxidoreductase [Microbacterium sp. MPKO10]|uniref:NAD(P)-dependent oxidoreductase n=1 Tax=Microbacterium sp. MPKO10 TaxID=2989818 RepID=UPI0022366E9D|nr:NAD(P)H-binding protein [Microbacterium sp. MPKO10]MCW4459229.1 NAD(P)H-binding protein [Microbacterium sp. MPKO10]